MQRSPTSAKVLVRKKRISNVAVTELKRTLIKLANGKRRKESYKPLTSANFSTQSWTSHEMPNHCRQDQKLSKNLNKQKRWINHRSSNNWRKDSKSMKPGKLVMLRMSERPEILERKIVYVKHQAKVSSKARAGKGNPNPYPTSKKKNTKTMGPISAKTAAPQRMSAVPE